MNMCYEDAGCMPKTAYKFLGKSGVWPANSAGLLKTILADTSNFSIFSMKNNCKTIRGSGELEHICGVLYFDIKGFKNPNTAGKDLFVFWITKGGIIPMGRPLEGDSDNPSSYLGYLLSKECKTGTGFGCTAWVILKENMDYLKQEVSW